MVIRERCEENEAGYLLLLKLFWVGVNGASGD